MSSCENAGDLTTIPLEKLVRWVRWADLYGYRYIQVNGVAGIEVAHIKLEIHRRVPSEPHTIRKP